MYADRNYDSILDYIIASTSIPLLMPITGILIGAYADSHSLALAFAIISLFLASRLNFASSTSFK